MSEKTKLIVWSSVLGVLVLAIGGAGYYFLWMQRIQKTKSEIEDLDKQVKKMRDKVKQIPTLKKQKRDLKASMDEFKKALPSLEENTPEQFMEELHAIAGDVGVNVTQYSPAGGGGPGGGNAGYETIQMDITVQGEVFRLFRYIWTLENQDRLMRVNSFSLSPDEQQLTSTELQELRGENFVYPSGGETKEDEKIKTYVGQMSIKTTVYIYSPPN